MKRALTITLLFLIALGLAAQTVATDPAAKTADTAKPKAKFRNMAVSFSAGYSLAMGNYRGVDYFNGKSGYASDGFIIQGGFAWMGKRDLGIEIQYTFQKNALQDTAKYVIPHGQTDSLGTDPWMNHYLLIGPVFIKSFNKLNIEARILGGLIYSFSSNFNTTDPASGKINQNQGAGFALEIGAGAGYLITPNIALRLNINLLAGWPVKNRQYYAQLIRWEEVTDPYTGIKQLIPIYSAPVEYEIKKVVTTLNPVLGIIFKF